MHRASLRSRTTAWPRSLGIVAVAAIAGGCGTRERATVKGSPAYLYASAADCQASLRTGPNDTTNRPLQGVVALIPAGASLSITGEDIGKEALCLRVEYGAARGYVLAACGRLSTPGRDDC